MVDRSGPRRKSGHRCVDPFDPKYAHVPLDVPISHVEDYVKRKNSRNDQDHLQSQIMFFKKEFGNLHGGKSRPKTSSSSTATASSSHSTSTQTLTQNDDHKDDSDHDDEDQEHSHHLSLLNMAPMLNFQSSDDFILPSFESLNSIRSALARYESQQYRACHHRHSARHQHLSYRRPLPSRHRHSDDDDDGDDHDDEEHGHGDATDAAHRSHRHRRMARQHRLSRAERLESARPDGVDGPWRIDPAQRHQRSDDRGGSSLAARAGHGDDGSTEGDGGGDYQYVAPFYNPFLRVHLAADHDAADTAGATNYDDDDTKHSNDGADATAPSTASAARPRRTRIIYDTAFESMGAMDHIFPLSHYQQNRTRNTNTDSAHLDAASGLGHDSSTQTTAHDAHRRYVRSYRRYRHSFRALQQHYARRRLRQQSQHSDGGDRAQSVSVHDAFDLDGEFVRDNLYILPTVNYEDNGNVDQTIVLQTTSSPSHGAQNEQRHRGGAPTLSGNRHFSRLQSILTFNATLSDEDDGNVKVKVAAPKMKCYSSRLDGLADFKAAASLIPLKLTAVDPFGQRIAWSARDSARFDDDCKMGGEATPSAFAVGGDRVVLQGIDPAANLLAQLSSDLHLIILNMITGLGNVRTMALYRSLSSALSGFDRERIRDCSVYKCQALFVERYRQNLFDERYKALHQPELIRALSAGPRNLFEFQQDRQRRVLSKQSSISSASNSEDSARYGVDGGEALRF